jgi:hypothetical protein
MGPNPATMTIGHDPYLVAAVLLISGLFALLLASFRRRTKPERAWVSRLHVIVATVAILLCAHSAYRSSSLFWSASWDADARTLVLERPGPFGTVHLEADDVDRVVEIAAPERSVTGLRARVHFEVWTTSGEIFRSAPAYERQRADRARDVLVAAADQRLERLLIGSAHRALR